MATNREKKIRRLLCALLIVPIWLAAVNFAADPANLFHPVSEEAAGLLLSGKPVYITSGNLDEPRVKLALLTESEPAPDTVAVGSSVVMCVNEAMVSGEVFYNLGESGADLYNILAIFAMMELYDRYPERVIFSVDSYFFDPYKSGVGFEADRDDKYYPYAVYMLGVLGLNGNDGEPVPPEGIADRESLLTRMGQLFSISYFQSAVKYAQAQGTLFPDRYGVADETTESAYYMPDGSRVYDADMRARTAEEVAADAAGYDIAYQFSAGMHPSIYSMEVFEALLDRLEERGVEVELFIAPVAPSLWDRIDPAEYPILSELEDYARETAAKRGLYVTGSYNPYKVGATDADYYDCRHLRRESLGKFFEFK